MNIARKAFVLLLHIIPIVAFCQDQQGNEVEPPKIPPRFFTRLQKKVSSLNAQVEKQTDKYLRRNADQEARIFDKLRKVDHEAANSLFSNSQNSLAKLSGKLKSDTGTVNTILRGDYQSNIDTLKNMLRYLQSNASNQLPNYGPQLQNSLKQFQTLESKMNDAEEIKGYLNDRRQLIDNYLNQHPTTIPLIGKDYKALNQNLYYYSQQIHEFRETLNDPDKLQKQAMAIVSKIPQFQTFMKQHSQLAGLFNIAGDYGDPASVIGLQTKDQVASLIQDRLSPLGKAGTGALQTNLQAAQKQLASYKDKLDQFGTGAGDGMDLPGFKPNAQKTKTFWKRLEYGTNFQTTQSTRFYPTTSDLGLSVGYKINDNSTIGIGTSYKLGWGNSFQHISFSSQGCGIRSFIDMKIKGSFFASGGFEYNHTQPFSNFQELKLFDQWTKSGLIGIKKTISMKSRFFKQTNLQLLWDFLSYQQVPKTQAVLFRVGYSLH